MRNPIIYFCFCITIINISACKQGKNEGTIGDLFSSNTIDKAALSSKITNSLNATFLLNNKDTFKFKEELVSLYKLNNNEPIWLNDNQLSTTAKSLLTAMDSLDQQGLSSAFFNKQELLTLEKTLKSATGNNAVQLASELELNTSMAALNSGNAILHGYYKPDSVKEFYNKQDTLIKVSTVINRLIKSKDSIKHLYTLLQPQLKEYIALKNKLAELKSIESKGGWPNVIGLKDSLTEKNKGAEIVNLRKRLFKEIGVPKDTTADTPDESLVVAIKLFQYQHDLRTTGKIDTSTARRLSLTVVDKIKQVTINLDRLRWIQRSYPQPYVWVNVPTMNLEYFDKDSLQYKMRVVVGRVSRPTPTLDAQMSDIVINPGWSVPPTIMKEEIIPGVKRGGGTYLAKRGLKAFRGGREVNPSLINEKNFKAFTIQQKPGLNSSLGAVKFNMPNRHAIYLHDTPHRGDFKNHYRAYSSGCVRVEKPRDFAVFLLNDSNYTAPKVDSMIRTKVTKAKELNKKIGVHIVYVTNAIDSLGNVRYLRDIYNYDNKLVKLVK